MKKILNKWYFSLILLPVFLNYLTSWLSAGKLINDWKIATIVCQTILIFILAYEYVKEYKNRKDIEILRSLFEKLDLKMFEEEIIEQNAWYGFKKQGVLNLLDFQRDASLLINKTSNKKVNTLMHKLLLQIRSFNDYASLHVYGRDEEWYVPIYEKEDSKRKEDR